MRINAKRITLAASAAALLLASADAHSWCWKRENGRTTEGCASGYREACCDGTLEKWPADGGTGLSSASYRISTSTDPARVPDVELGFGKWNAVEMSTFSFERGSDTAVWGYGQDGINLINVDSQFCSHYPEYCGVGLLGFSMVYTRDEGVDYKPTEADIILNAEDFTFGPENVAGDDVIDTVAVVAHEAGHNAGLSHPGGICRGAGSRGCGAESFLSTMYWAYDVGVDTDKWSLELDDVAAIVAGYPAARFRVRVVHAGVPVEGAKVTVNGTAFPIEISADAADAYGVSMEGGYVIGDVTSADTLFGNGAISASYLAEADHFSLTDSDGYTEYRVPVTSRFSVKATLGMAATTTAVDNIREELPAGGQKTIVIELDTTSTEDFGSPGLEITSHADGQLLAESTITVRGTASDAGYGDHGISSVKVNDVRAINDTAIGAGTAEWARTLELAEGANRIEVTASDDSSTPQWNQMTKVIMVTCDTTAPEVVQTSPEAGVIDPDRLVDPEENVVIALGFSEKVDEATVENAANLLVSYVNNEGDTVFVGGVRVYDADTKVVTFTPGAELEYSKTYTITATTGITDLAGNPLAEDFVFKLSTRAVTDSEAPGNGGNKGAGKPDTSGQGSCFMETLFTRD